MYFLKTFHFPLFHRHRTVYKPRLPEFINKKIRLFLHKYLISLFDFQMDILILLMRPAINFPGFINEFGNRLRKFIKLKCKVIFGSRSSLKPKALPKKSKAHAVTRQTIL